MGVVMLLQLADAMVQAVERSLVRRQHQHRVGQLAEAPQRCQPVTQRIGLRLGHRDQDAGGNARQDLVTSDQQLVVLAVQAHMFR